MKKPAIFFVSSCLMFVISFVQCEECDSKEVCGECPFVSTVANLDKKRFSGVWYSIQDSSPPRIPCMHYDIKKSSDGFRVKFLPYNIKTDLVQKDLDDISQGFRSVSRFEKINGGNFTVFDTDYDNFAGIFNCKKTESEFSYSVTFWSRTRELSEKDVNRLKSVISRFEVDVTELENVFQSQDGCGKNDHVVRMAKMTLLPLLDLDSSSTSD